MGGAVSAGFPIVDIHVHILPALDDGPATMEESLRMCELCVEQGVTTVVATPHMGGPTDAATPGAVRRGVGELSQACRERGLELEILPGAEVRLHPELLEVLDADRILTLADGHKYLLLELPLQVVPRIEGLVFELELRGITPVLNHPERNLEFWRKPHRLADLVDRGCLVQVTGDSLLGRAGRDLKRVSQQFLESGLVHVVGSDAHAATGSTGSPQGGRSPNLRQVAEMLHSSLEGDVARTLLQVNPEKIVRGEPLVPLLPEAS